jgi:hypothetical protein
MGQHLLDSRLCAIEPPLSRTASHRLATALPTGDQSRSGATEDDSLDDDVRAFFMRYGAVGSRPAPPQASGRDVLEPVKQPPYA